MSECEYLSVGDEKFECSSSTTATTASCDAIEDISNCSDSVKGDEQAHFVCDQADLCCHDMSHEGKNTAPGTQNRAVRWAEAFVREPQLLRHTGHLRCSSCLSGLLSQLLNRRWQSHQQSSPTLESPRAMRSMAVSRNWS